MLLFSLLLVLSSSFAAAASLRWTWSYSAPGIVASGVFLTTGTPNSQGAYQIVSIRGVRNGRPITVLQRTGTAIPGNEPYVVDNLVFPGGGPQLTKNGFGFAVSGGTYSNPFYASFLRDPGYLEFYSMPQSGRSTEDRIHFSAAIVPEPGSFGLLLLGALAVWRIRPRCVGHQEQQPVPGQRIILA